MLTSRSGNRAQLKLGPPRTPTIGTVTWLSGHYSVPESVTGAEVEPYGDGRLLVVGTRHDPSIDTEAVLAVRAELDRAGVLVPAPRPAPSWPHYCIGWIKQSSTWPAARSTVASPANR